MLGLSIVLFDKKQHIKSKPEIRIGWIFSSDYFQPILILHYNPENSIILHNMPHIAYRIKRKKQNYRVR